MTHKNYGTGDLCKLSGLAQHQVRYLEQTGLLTPVGVDYGRARHRRYDFKGVLAARVIGRLRTAGVSLQSLRKALAKVKRWRGTNTAEALTGARWLVVGQEVSIVDADGLTNALTGQRVCVSLDLGSELLELRQAEAELRKAG